MIVTTLRTVLLLALVAAMPLASAATTSGDLAFPDGLRAEGALRLRADLAFADLSRGAEEGLLPALSWEGATLRVVRGYREYWTDMDVFVQNSADNDIENESLRAGRLSALACAEACKLFAFTQDGRSAQWALDAALDADLRRVGEPTTYWTGYDVQEPDTFAYDVPAGWINVSPSAREPFLPTLVQDASLTATGAIGVVVWGAEIVLETEGGERRVETGVFHEERTGPGGVALGRSTENRFAILLLKGGALSAARGAPFTFSAAAPTLEVSGALAAPEAHGSVVVDGQRREVRGESVRIEGTLLLAPEFTLPLASAIAPPASPHGVESSFRGDASRVVVGGASLASSPSLSGSVAVGLTVAGVLALLLAALKLAGLLPVYTRITPENALRNDNRREVYALLSATRGATIPEIMERTGIVEAVVRHHLRILEKQRLVFQRKLGRTKVFFRADAAPRAETLDAQIVIRGDSRRLVGEALCRAPLPLTQTELAAMTGLSPRLVSYHLGKLEKKGLVVGDGATPRRYRAADPLRRLIPTPTTGQLA